jgi:hypothetical protein
MNERAERAVTRAEVYGADHSPWVQAVLPGLERLSFLAGFISIVFLLPITLPLIFSLVAIERRRVSVASLP